MSNFEVVGNIENDETFATGSGIREVSRLKKAYGRGRWRKRKGVAKIRFEDGTTGIRGVTLVRSHRHRPERI